MIWTKADLLDDIGNAQLRVNAAAEAYCAHHGAVLSAGRYMDSVNSLRMVIDGLRMRYFQNSGQEDHRMPRRRDNDPPECRAAREVKRPCKMRTYW